MGPGAGTAMLGGVGLGFANAVTPGRVGVVAAAGTGAQEVMCLLDRWGVGVSHVIGLGGRDLSAGGRRACGALRGRCAAGRPPDRGDPAGVETSGRRRRREGTGGRRTNTGHRRAGIGVEPTDIGGVVVTDTLEGGVVATLRTLGRPAPDTTATTLGPSVRDARRRLATDGRWSADCSRAARCATSRWWSWVGCSVRCGRTLPSTRLGDARSPGSHQCLDLGEEEYTRGRPHPMIDAEARLGLLREHAEDPEVAAIILDVVLGYGAHEDPAGYWRRRAQAIMADRGPQVVALRPRHGRGSAGLDGAASALADAGCLVTATSARASSVAAAIATGRPEMADEVL